MARFCSDCNKKMGFFEEEFEGRCRECHNKRIEEELEKNRIEMQKRMEEQKALEEKRKQEEQKRLEEQKALEEKRRQEEQKRLEEQKALEEKRRQEEQKRLEEQKALEEKRRQEEQKRLEEERKMRIKAEQNFSQDFSNSILATKLYTNIWIRDNLLENLILKENYQNVSSYNIIDYILKLIVSKLKEEYTFDDIVQTFNNSENIIEVIKEFINLDEIIPTKHYDTKEELIKESAKTVHEKLNFYFEKNMANIYISKVNQLDGDVTLFDVEDDVVEDYIECIKFISKNEYQTYNDYDECQYNKCVYTIIIFYFYAFLIIYYSRLENYIDIFKSENELYQIYINLQNEVKDDTQYIANKVYSIYKNCYSEIFPEKLSESEFLSIIFINTMKEVYNNLAKDFELDEIKNIILKDNIDDKERLIEKIGKEIVNNEKMKVILFQGEDMSTLRYIIQRVLSDILNEYKNLDITLYSFSNINLLFQNIDNEMSAYQAKLDRERYLKGDFSKEKEMQKQELEYSSIQNGYDFEQYVANLYKKLGYIIDEVTKKSGDQGADIIANKDNVKYVIQTKFYSNPVGNKAVQEVVAAIAMYNANKGIVVTNSTFTSSAIELANANSVELVDGKNLEKLKKEIVKNINTNNEDKDELELYIEDIFERAELVDIDKDDEKAFQKRLASFGQAYAVKEGTDFYNKEKIQRFIDAFFKNAELIINNEQFDLQENRKTVEILIKAGICSVYINEFLQPILEDEQLDENEKMEIINIKVNEYANNDDDGMDKVPKVFALEIFFNFSILEDETEEDENSEYYNDEENLEYFDNDIEDYNDFNNDIQDYDDFDIEDDSTDFLDYDSNDIFDDIDDDY